MYKIINRLVLGLLPFVFLWSQNTFMTSIDLNNDAEYSIQIIRLEDGYLVSSFSRCMNNSVGCIGL
ncbi:MAG: hypothetical protein KF852_19840 [Saprospiraceae bacterium]|nr:hypothetical protein [Saprospiraceae bacterium]